MRQKITQEIADLEALAEGRAAVVKFMDKNNDGVVNQDEFLAAGGSKEDFQKYDVNGDGVLDAKEAPAQFSRGFLFYSCANEGGGVLSDVVSEGSVSTCDCA